MCLHLRGKDEWRSGQVSDKSETYNRSGDFVKITMIDVIEL